MGIKQDYRLAAPDGTNIEVDEIMTYLGAYIYPDGRVKSELNKRLGIAWADFCKLDRLWKHTFLPKARKIMIFNAVVTSKLLYSLSSAWLNIAELRRLDGFQCRCLRRILRIKPSVISRISNATVLSEAQQPKMRNQLLKQQLLLYGRVVRSSPSSTIRRVTFVGSSMQATTDRYVRRVGRPRNEWTTMLQKETIKMGIELETCLHHINRWKDAVQKYCSHL